jgi:pimeloyl-ACP methyl ester carboxylesterase
MTDTTARPDTIVLIHGLWMNGLSWEHWAARYQGAGYRVLTPSWPGMEGSVEALRADTSGFDELGIDAIVDHYAAIIEGLEQPPIIMGHSFGGVFTQLLLARGLGFSGVAVDSGPVKGLRKLPFSTLKSGFPILKRPSNRHRAVLLTPEEFHYSFANTLSEADSLAAYERYSVPGPGGVLFEGALANFSHHAATAIDFTEDERAPLLFIAGGEDHVAPPATNRENADRYKKSTAITAFKEFPGRGHFTVGEPGWEDVADYALAWAVAPTAETMEAGAAG